VLSIASAAVQTDGGTRSARRIGARARADDWLAAERHQLVLWAPVMLGAGILGYFALPHVGHWRAVACVGAALIAAGAATRGLVGRCVAWAGALLLVGLALAWTRADSVATARLQAPRFAQSFTATVVAAEDQPARDRHRLLLEPDDPSLPPRVRVSLRQAPPEGVTPGARVRLRATLSAPPGPSVPGGYDFARRAWFEGVGAVGYGLGSVELVEARPARGALAWFDRVRRDLTGRLQARVGDAAGGIAAALVTGDRGGIPENVTEAMRDSGLAHLLSISGMHIATVVGGTMWLVRRLLLLSPWLALRWPVKLVAAGVAAVAGIAYTLLAGAEVPTVRACIATIILLIGIAIGRQAISLRMVAAGAFLILVVRPEALLGPSFQLSFAAVAAIVALYQSPLGRRLLTPNADASIVVRLARSLLALGLTGIVVEAALAPIAMAHFGRTGFYGVLANIVAIPFTSFVVIPAAAFALLLDPLGIAAPAYAVLRWSLDFLILLANTVASWPGAVSRVPSMPVAAFAGFVGGGLWLVLWQESRRWFGLAPIAVSAVAASLAAPADLIVGPDGRHVGIVDGRSLVMLRPRQGSFTSDMWSDATATETVTGWADAPAARCNRDACVTDIERRGRRWRLLATRSKAFLDWCSLTAACAEADIVVSDRWLPDACRPRWLKLDRAALARTGAVALWLDPVRVRTVAETHGDHPWATAAPDQWYRRSSPTSLPWTRTRDGK